MKSWEKIAAVLGPLVLWGGLAAHAGIWNSHETALAAGDYWASVPFIVLGLLLLGFSARTVTTTPWMIAVILLCALALTFSVLWLHWSAWHFFLSAGVLTLVFELLVLARLRRLSPGSPLTPSAAILATGQATR